MNGLINFSDVERKATGHFFDKDTTRFFNSRYPQSAYQLGDKAYFITSERFDYNSPRLYTLRVIDLISGKIDTVGEFNHMSKSECNTALKHIIAENK